MEQPRLQACLRESEYSHGPVGDRAGLPGGEGTRSGVGPRPAADWVREMPGGATCLSLPLPTVRRLARKRRSTGDEDPRTPSLSDRVHVASVNNFPTAAGLASSAAGFACLGRCPRPPQPCLPRCLLPRGPQPGR